MNVDRRTFLNRAVSATAGVSALAGLAGEPLEASPREGAGGDEAAACLVDTTRCIGCRKCEEACFKANRLPEPEASFDAKWVFRRKRRPDGNRFTVVNAHLGHPSEDQPDRSRTYVKTQCMHCLDPACVSACIVGALSKSAHGPVVYDPGRCIGCRYCMVACPFEIPAYEYHEAVTPRVRKCTFCADEAGKANPACAAACPVEAIVFGTRGNLLELAHDRIRRRPDRYQDHLYGEHEAGGTSWMYLTGRPTGEIDLKPLPRKAPPRLTESIQHGIFRYGLAPFLVYGGLAALMWRTNRKGRKHEREENESPVKES